MVRIAGPQDHILKLDIDMVIIICNILLQDHFLHFKNFFQTWFPYQTPQQIYVLLDKLDWTFMDVYERPYKHLKPNRSFVAFLDMCKDRRINHALCYDASKNLIVGNMPEENLDVLEGIADEHSASFLAFHVFRPVYRAGTIEDSATSLLRRLGDLRFRAEFEDCVLLLMYRRRSQGKCWEDRPVPMRTDVLLCSSGVTSSTLHFNVRGLPPTLENILSCTCTKCFIQRLWYIIYKDY